jgi:hypothetical protein
LKFELQSAMIREQTPRLTQSKGTLSKHSYVRKISSAHGELL